MEMEQIYQIPMRNQDVLNFQLKEYRGKEYFDVRIFFQSKEGQKILPTKKGLTLEANMLRGCLEGLSACLKVYEEKIKNKVEVSG